MRSAIGVKQRATRLHVWLQAMAMCVCSTSAFSAVVTGPGSNISVPATLDGVYINFVTGASGTSGAAVPGWDFDPYVTSNQLQFFWPNTTTGQFGGVATGTSYRALAIGTVVSSASTFSVTFSGTSGTPYHTTADSYLGFRFFNETTNSINYGYLRMTTTAGSPGGLPATVVCWRYEDSGGPIAVAPCGPGVAPAVITYTPAPGGTVNFPTGPAGTANTTIGISASGATGGGQTTIQSCTVSGPNAGAFGTVSSKRPSNPI